jgi:hypothetical protein
MVRVLAAYVLLPPLTKQVYLINATSQAPVPQAGELLLYLYQNGTIGSSLTFQAVAYASYTGACSVCCRCVCALTVVVAANATAVATMYAFGTPIKRCARSERVDDDRTRSRTGGGRICGGVRGLGVSDTRQLLDGTM